MRLIIVIILLKTLDALTLALSIFSIFYHNYLFSFYLS